MTASGTSEGGNRQRSTARGAVLMLMRTPSPIGCSFGALPTGPCGACGACEPEPEPDEPLPLAPVPEPLPRFAAFCFVGSPASW